MFLLKQNYPRLQSPDVFLASLPLKLLVCSKLLFSSFLQGFFRAKVLKYCQAIKTIGLHQNSGTKIESVSLTKSLWLLTLKFVLAKSGVSFLPV